MAPSVFLAASIDKSKQYRDNLLFVMESAGMSIRDIQDQALNEQDLKSGIDRELFGADCSLHILSPDFGETLFEDSTTSFAAYQLNQARQMLHEKPDFKVFIWYPPEVVAAVKDDKQQQFINQLRNSLERNMIFSNASSPVQLVDDIRTLMEKEEKTTFDLKDAEVFLIFNELDESQADEIIDMISDIIDVEKLNIIQDSDIDYSSYCSQQIGKSKLAVIYFKETSDWALPFAQQIWKKTGGATSHTPILLIGDDDPDSNMNKKLKAPKIISLIVSGALIPLEIKIQYDKVVEDVA